MYGPACAAVCRAAPFLLTAMPCRHIEFSSRLDRSEDRCVNVRNNRNIFGINLGAGASEVRAIEVGAIEVGASEVGTSEVGISEVGISEVGASEVGVSLNCQLKRHLVAPLDFRVVGDFLRI